MTALMIGAMAQGLAYSLLAWGALLTFRLLRFADITVDGSFTTGAAVAGVWVLSGRDPVVAILLAMLAGMVAGTLTGLLHTKLAINDLLAGILSMTALYSVNLHIMGRSNLALIGTTTVASRLQTVLPWLNVDLAPLCLFAGVALLVFVFLAWFLRTDLGMAIRATGDNPRMATANGISVDAMKIVGLALSNGLVGACGGLMAQHQGFADVTMGIGTLVAAVAALILGESLFGKRSLGWTLFGVGLGAVVFRLIVALALSRGLDPIDLKLATALFVVLALMVPTLKRRFARRRPVPVGVDA
ncbi:MAG: ABC transporter permease [Fimbriimonadaceae bacterium]|nr:ABC transporter permease [Fimbriimonadaceae bacterium]